MSEIILNPTIVDEIEFYVSPDQKVKGLSIAGLSRLCGVDAAAISRLLNSLQSAPSSTAMTKSGVKSLESLHGNVFIPGVKGMNGAKIVDSKAASRIVRYYAYESKAANEVAKHSYDKFAEIGIDNWVLQVTGCANDSSEIMKVLKQLVDQVEKLEVTTRKYQNIKTTAVTIFPGLDHINSEIESDDYLLESVTEDKRFTAAEWLESKGLILTPSMKQKFTLMLGQTYQAITQKKPEKVTRRDKQGKLNQRLNSFTTEEEPILQIVLKKLFNQI